MTNNKTFMAKKESVERCWYVIDATDKPLGRLASAVSKILTGKNKPVYTPHVDCGDYVIITNAEKIKLTGRKRQQSLVHSYSGYPGGLKAVNYATILEKHPEKLVEKVVKGMLPKNRLKTYLKLKVYAGPNHPHASQKPVELEV